MNEWSAVRFNSWAGTVHAPGPVRHGGPLGRDVLVAHACALHPRPLHADVGVQGAIARYEGTRSYRTRSGHVAA